MAEELIIFLNETLFNLIKIVNKIKNVWRLKEIRRNYLG